MNADNAKELCKCRAPVAMGLDTWPKGVSTDATLQSSKNDEKERERERERSIDRRRESRSIEYGGGGRGYIVIVPKARFFD